MSRRRPDPADPTKVHDDLSDLFRVDVEPDSGLPIRNEPVVTGLSDEEDAQRALALRFNPDLRFCPNCEITLDTKKTGFYCPRCHSGLAVVGSPAKRRKHT